MDNSSVDVLPNTEFTLDQTNMHDYLVNCGELSDVDMDRIPNNIAMDFLEEPTRRAYSKIEEVKRQKNGDNLEVGFGVYLDTGSSLGVNHQTGNHLYRVEATEISVGKKEGQQESSVTSIMSEGNLPLVDAHSHPTQSMFTSVDYAPLIFTCGGYRLTRGILLLLPGNLQVFALATKDTPKYDDTPEGRAKGNQMLESMMGENDPAVAEVRKESHSRLTELNRRLDAIGSKGGLLRRIGRKIGVVGFSNEEKRELKGVGDALELSQQKEEGELRYAFNQNQVATARRLGVALYTSTNCRDFVKWSA